MVADFGTLALLRAALQAVRSVFQSLYVREACVQPMVPLLSKGSICEDDGEKRDKLGFYDIQ